MRSSRWPGAAPIALLFVALVIFRLATAEIVNDDFLHLAVAQQILLGDVPVRDFIDPGEFLFNYTSAAAQWLFGRTVGSEVLLDVVFLCVAHVLVFVLGARASASRLLALLTTALSVTLVTRLYSYPKLFLYPLALLLMWRYADHRSVRALHAGALCTAVAFLFRHDHGANIGAAMVVTVVLVHWRDWHAMRDRVFRLASATALLVLPFLVFLQVTGGGASYWRNTIETGRAEYQRTVGPYPRFTEAAFAGADNAAAWFYYLTILLPPLTLAVVAGDAYARRGHAARARHRIANEPQKMAAAAALAMVMQLFLLRAASESAVADVSALTAVLGAWLLGRAFRSAVVPTAVSALILGTTLWFARYTEGAEAVRSVAAELTDDEPGPLFRRFGEFWRMAAPFDDEGARYVFACTADTDRLLVASAYAPHAYYAAGRGFAAGRQYFLSSQGPSAEFRAFSARRLEQQRVPIVLVNPPDYDAFAAGFAAIHRHLQAHYRPVGMVEFDESPLTVLVDARIAPTGTWGERALPCFQPARPPD